MKHDSWVKQNKKLAGRLFIIYILCIFIPLATLMTYSSISRISRDEQNYNAQLNQQSQAALRIITDKLTDISATGYTIFTARWYNHYNTVTTLFRDEFDYLKRMEITADLNAKMIAMEYVYDILVVTPSFDNVIHRVGWYSLRDYQNYFGDVLVPGNQDSQSPSLAVAENRKPLYYQILLDDPTSRLNATTVSILINKKSFSDYIASLLDDASYIWIGSSSQTLCERGSADAEGQMLIRKSAGMQARIIYPSFRQVQRPTLIFIYVLQMIIALLGTILLAGYLTIKNVVPLRSLLSRFPGMEFCSEKDAYQYIGRCIDGMTQENSQMRQENLALNDRLARYFQERRSDLLAEMLTNPEFNYDEDQSVRCFKSRQPFMLILIPASAAETGVSLAGAGSANLCVTLANHERCLVIWFADEQDAEEKMAQVQKTIADQVGDHPVSFSGLLADPRQIRQAYQILRRDNTCEKTASRKKDDTIALIKEYIDEYYADADMSIKHLEDRFGLVGSVISKKFKSEAGMTFSDYLLERRIAVSEKLLQGSGDSIMNIAKAVGYANYISFKRAFFRIKGMSPLDYRRKLTE